MGCSIDGSGIEADVIVDGEMTGLLAGHAYGLIDCMFVNNPNAYNEKKRHRLLRIRNPWGAREWNGKWSDRSDELRDHLNVVQEEVNKLGSDELWDPYDNNDGTFLMCFKDWRSIYTNLFACVDFTDEWSGIRFVDAWTEHHSGGVP